MILDDVLAFCQDQGVVTSDWPMFCGYMPDDQDQTMGIFETGGYPPDSLDRSQSTLTFQLRVRGQRLSYSEARDQWLRAFTALQDSTLGLYPQYIFVQTLHYGPMTFNDNKGRPNFTSNFRVMMNTETASV